MSGWLVAFDAPDPANEGVREALCTLGNGYLATRGSTPEHRADGTHYPGTYLAGCYNRLVDTVDGEFLESESLVNVPSWLPVSFRTEGGSWLGDPAVEVLADRHELDLGRGLLMRRLRVRDETGRMTTVTQRRFVHLSRPHVCGLQTTITPVGWSGRLVAGSHVDISVENRGVSRYSQLSARHLGPALRAERVDDQSMLCVLATNQSYVRLALAARTRLTGDGGVVGARHTIVDPAAVGEEIDITVHDGRPITLDKVVVVFTSHDAAISAPDVAAVELIGHLEDFDDLLAEHVVGWHSLWRRFHVEIAGVDEAVIRTVRLHLFHVLQALSPNSADADVGVPARGLHGEAYRGHVLWDELFVLPLLHLRLPMVSRALLMYRYRRLPAARRAARAAGRVGAMFPWQSGSDGREENQSRHLNPVSGRWIADDTHRQRHVGLAIAYNTWQYCQATGDRQFLEDHGGEVIVEIARYFADLAEYDHGKDRFVIRGVMGPDEFHTGYPDRPAAGIDNNAYTNVMTAWLMARATETLRSLPPDRCDELREAVGLLPAEEQRWREISRRMFVPFHHDGVISQFEGYEQLDEFDWDRYRRRYGDIRRLDRILEAEGDDPNRYRASKQADALMLLYVFSADELAEILGRLDYRLDPGAIPRTVDFYLARTSHGSTLSAVVHAWVLARSRRAEALEHLRAALAADAAHVQGGSTAEGVHLAAMAGSVDLLQRCFGGVELRGNALVLNPYWPAELGVLEFDVRYRHHTLRLQISASAVRVSSARSDRGPIRVICRGQVARLEPGSTVELGGTGRTSSTVT
jgi:trehalose 6-phosphate phosphatase